MRRQRSDSMGVKARAFKQFLFHRPLIASLHLTSRCNLRCKHCPDAVTEFRQPDLNTLRWMEIMKSLKERGVIGLIIWGGEPMMRLDIEQIMAYANKHFITTFHTNGIQDFSNIKANAIFVSLDGDKEVNDSIRGEGTFDKIIDNIQKYPNKRRIVIGYTFHQMNRYKVSYACNLANELGVRIGFQSYYTEKAEDPLKLSDEDREKCYREIRFMKMCIRPSYPILNSHANLTSMIKGGHKCHRWAYISIDSSGKEHQKCLPNVNCEHCNLMCFNEINLALSLKRDAIGTVRYTFRS